MARSQREQTGATSIGVIVLGANPLAASGASRSVRRYASTINSKPPGRVARGSTPSPGAGGLVSQRQDELGL